MVGKYLKALIPLFIFVVLAWFMYERLNNEVQPNFVPSQQVGKPAASFSLPTVLDPLKTISSDTLLGKVWVLNIWGSWCPTCRYEHPVFMRLAKSGVVPIYGLNWKDENLDDAVQWLNRYENPYVASGFDPSGRTGMDYGAYAAPETFIVDKQGIVRFHFRGEVTQDLVDSQMLPLIRELNK